MSFYLESIDLTLKVFCVKFTSMNVKIVIEVLFKQDNVVLVWVFVQFLSDFKTLSHCILKDYSRVCCSQSLQLITSN